VIPRYARPEMAALWTPEAKYASWLRVELAVCEELGRRGEIPRRALQVIKKKARFDAARIDAIEKKVKHDVIAFLTNVAEIVGPEARYIHMGLTSSDVLDTALALQLRASADLLLADLRALLAVLEKRAREHKRTVMIGRSHGMHAEPITFGLKLALWHAEMARHRARLERAREAVAVGKLSGAVGTFAYLDPGVERAVLDRLGLTAEPVASQVVQRDRHAEFFTTLAIVGASIEKIAVEIRHLQRTEVGEVEEFFSEGQKGSSAMPHKRNPIASENLSGLARVLRGNALAALENVPLWHERDISHSSVERIIAPDSTILLDYMLARLTNLLERLVVYPKRMKRNLALTQGLVFSQRVLLALARRGVAREEAYEWVQRCAMRTLKEGEEFKRLLSKDPDVSRTLKTADLEACFDLEAHLKHVDTLFKRAFGGARSTGRQTPGKSGSPRKRP
jgi:adenylosuccinate lyase